MTTEKETKANEILELIGNLNLELEMFVNKYKDGASEFKQVEKEMRKIYDTWEDGIVEENYDGPAD